MQNCDVLLAKGFFIAKKVWSIARNNDVSKVHLVFYTGTCCVLLMYLGYMYVKQSITIYLKIEQIFLSIPNRSLHAAPCTYLLQMSL